MFLLKQKTLSQKAVLLFIPILIVAGFNPKNWNNNYIISQDAAIYYAYLPATIIYKDISLAFIDELPSDFEGNIVYSTTPEGNKKILKMTMGVALLHFPFFLTAHTLTFLFLPFNSNGYSPPYEIAVYLSTIFYVVIGLFFTRKILLKRFSEHITTITLIILLFATNLFFYSTLRAGTSHGYSFALFAASIFLFERWHKNPSMKNTILIGIVTGLVILVRPTNALIATIFILYGVHNKQSFYNKIGLFLKNYHKLLLMIFIAMIVFIPQLLYWKYITGDWIYYSYKDEGFFFHDPEIIKGLFSFRKGWLIYTPVMILSLVGMFLLYRNSKKYMITIPVFFALNVYLIYSWWTWWYGGSFGSRPMIDSYSLLAIPIASFMNEVYYYSKWKKYTAVVAVCFFIILNLWQSKQYKRGIIHYDGMTKKAYTNLFFSYKRPKNYNQLIDRPDYHAAKKNIERTLSYYKTELNPAQQKIYDIAYNNEALKNKLLAHFKAEKHSYEKILKMVIMNPSDHPSAHKLIINSLKDKIKSIITNNKKWYSKIKRIAAEKNEPVDSVLMRHVNYVYQTDYQKKLDEFKSN